MLNGPVENGGDVTVSLEEHKHLMREKEELTEQVKEMEKRLEELKVKNNVREKPPDFEIQHGVRTLSLPQTLRDNCWKARDDAATLEKTCDQKLKQAYREAEVGCAHACVCALCYPPLPSPFQQRCKAAKAEALTEARDAQKVLPLKPPFTRVHT